MSRLQYYGICWQTCMYRVASQLEYNKNLMREHLVSNVLDFTDSLLVYEIVLEDLKGFSTPSGA